MLTVAPREYLTLAILLLIFIIFLIPSLLTTRAAVRDGLRQQDITYLKRTLENYYNTHEFYPPSPKHCLISTSPGEWFFVKVMPHDVREEYGYLYRYCATSGDAAGSTGYFLEAQLEVDQKDQRSFDEDEQRKFHYHILHTDGKTLYRVCGGQEKQCQE